MEEQQRNIDEVFRKSLADYREAPPGAVWQRIANRLDEEDGRRRGGFMRWPWAMLSLLLIVGTGWMVVGLNRQKTETTIQALPSVHNLSNEIKQQSDHSLIKPVAYSRPEVLKTNAVSDVVAKPIVKTIHIAQIETTHPIAAEEKVAPINLFMILPGNVVEAGIPSLEAGQQIGRSDVILERNPDLIQNLELVRKGEASLVTLPLGLPDIKPIPDVAVSHALSVAKEPVQVVVPTTAVQQSEAWTKQASTTLTALVSIDAANGLSASALIAPRELNAFEGVAHVSVLPAPEERDNTPMNILQAVPGAAFVASSLAGPMPTMASEAPSAVRVAPSEHSEIVSEAQMPEPIKAKHSLPISLAAIVGYEGSFGTLSLSRYSAAAKLLWQVSNMVSIGLQPAFRYGSLRSVALSPDQAFQRGSLSIDSTHTADNSPTVFGGIDTIYNYVIRENFDSIVVKGQSAGSSFWEVELPLIIHFNLGKAWYIYGGPSLNFGGKLTYKAGGEEHTFTVTRRDSIAQSIPIPGEGFNNYFGKSALQQYGTIKPTEAPVEDAAPLRLGYLAGLGYSWQRFFAEASLHQQLTGYSSIPTQLRDVYAAPSVRLSVGYRLFAHKPK